MNGLINLNHKDEDDLEMNYEDDKEQISMLNSQELPFILKSSEIQHFPNLTNYP